MFSLKSPLGQLYLLIFNVDLSLDLQNICNPKSKTKIQILKRWEGRCPIAAMLVYIDKLYQGFAGTSF